MLTVVKWSGDDDSLTDLIREKLGTACIIGVPAPPTSKMRSKFHHALTHVQMLDSSINRIFQWFGEPTPDNKGDMPEGTLLYFGEISP